MLPRYTDVHLPGEREANELARAIARDNRWTEGEWRAYRAAVMCDAMRERAEHGWYRPWRCTYQRPCIYCGDLR